MHTVETWLTWYGATAEEGEVPLRPVPAGASSVLPAALASAESLIHGAARSRGYLTPFDPVDPALLSLHAWLTLGELANVLQGIDRDTLQQQGFDRLRDLQTGKWVPEGARQAAIATSPAGFVPPVALSAEDASLRNVFLAGTFRAGGGW